MTPPTLSPIAPPTLLPPRTKVARTGKLRPITKAQAAAFNTAVLGLMARHTVSADLRSNGRKGFVSWRPDAPKVGHILVTLYPHQVGDFEVMVFVPRRLTAEVQPYSGAWHVKRPQAEDALAELRSKLAACGVSVPVI